ncbi:hypothetical protein BRADI_3g61009v3 [Brachypodium distachyon]|uniref:Uncharacterized protein n=1 Tax=Brachypodium distachyon TaxID=15368 RepID=A0A2K2D652_BRADI|nr:hypothetical protein BRADI_3g61009v3 [Brachypodium distachyon]PNT69759.1 hypothetical protein BRADI_3g61009v3 [Brachypodium distachyon]PNT69760.1 hypothetical protein BRADI_3g61009v3 [Brachypodium distachyon]PNT69763.1 hypothetical protein BRADI_3g61009v3 [Brachypodium distachyon]
MAIDPTEPGYTRKRGRKSKVATPEVTTELRRSPRLNMYRGFKSHQISDAHKKRQSIGESILLFFFFAGPRRGRKNSSELSTLTTLVRGGAESSRPPGGPCTPLPAARRSGCSSSWFSERWRRMRRGSRGRGVNAPPQLTLCPRCRRGEAERCPHLALEGHGRGAAVNAKVKQARISWAKVRPPSSLSRKFQSPVAPVLFSQSADSASPRPRGLTVSLLDVHWQSSPSFKLGQ